MAEETVVKDDLDGLTSDLADDQTPIVDKSTEAATGTADEVVTIDGKEVPYEDVIKAYKEDPNWKKSNTQEAQRLAEEKRQLEEQQRAIQDRETNLQAWESGLYQQRNTPTPQPGQPTQQAETPNYDDLELEPGQKAIMQRLDAQEQRVKTWQDEQEKTQFIAQTQTEHQRLKNSFSDYEPTQIERSIIAGRNQFEDVYKAQKFDQIQKGGKDAILALVTEDMMKEVKADVRKDVIEELRNREKARKAISSRPPEEGALSTIPPAQATNYTQAKDNILQTLHDEGLSLTK